MALEVVNFQGEQGEPGEDGADGVGGVAGAWAAGSSYAVGQIVAHEGSLWRLTAAESNNGYASRVDVVTHVQTVHSSTGMGSQSIPAGITSQWVSGDLVLLFVQAQVATWGSMTFTNLTEYRTESGTVGSYTDGVALYYAWHGGSTPSYNLANGTGRATWVLLRGVSASVAGWTSLGADYPSYAGWWEQYLTVSTESIADARGGLLIAGVLASDTTNGPTRFLDGTGVTSLGGRMLRIGASNSMTSSGSGTRYASVAALPGDSTSQTLSALWNARSLGGDYTQAAHFIAGVYLPPASLAAPYFDRTKWQQVSPVGQSDVFDLDDLGVWPGRFLIPVEGRRYSLTLDDDRMYGYATQSAIQFKAPAVTSRRTWVEVAYTQGVNPYRCYHTESNTSTLFGTPDTGTARFVTDGCVHEPGQAPYLTTVIRYEWDPTRQVWSAVQSSGTALVRDHRPYLSDLFTNYRFRVYFSPELQRSTDYEAALEAHTDALLGMPTATRAALSKYDQRAEVVRDGHLEEAFAFRGASSTAFSGISGLASAGGSAVASSYVGDGGEPPGKIMLHEIGHLWNFVCLPSRGFSSGVNPAADGYTASTAGNPGELRRETSLIDIFHPVWDADGSPSYYLKDSNEWVAQVLMLAWAEHIGGYTASGSSWDALVTGIGGSTVFTNAKAALVTLGAIPSSGSWS